MRDPWRISLPSDLSPGKYWLKLSLFDAVDSRERAQVSLGTLDVVARRVSFDVPPMQFPADHSFGDIATLLGYDLFGDILPGRAHVTVTLYWQALRTTDGPYTVGVRLVDANGLVLAEQESQPAAGAIPSSKWQPGEIVTDLHEMDIVGNEPVSGDLEVRLLDTAGNRVLLADGSEELVIPDVQRKVMWRIPQQ